MGNVISEINADGSNAQNFQGAYHNVGSAVSNFTGAAVNFTGTSQTVTFGTGASITYKNAPNTIMVATGANAPPVAFMSSTGVINSQFLPAPASLTSGAITSALGTAILSNSVSTTSPVTGGSFFVGTTKIIDTSGNIVAGTISAGVNAITGGSLNVGTGAITSGAITASGTISTSGNLTTTGTGSITSASGITSSSNGVNITAPVSSSISKTAPVAVPTSALKITGQNTWTIGENSTGQLCFYNTGSGNSATNKNFPLACIDANGNLISGANNA